MSIPLRVLLVESSEDDALLIIRELHNADYEPRYEQVDNPEDFDRLLAGLSWDIIIADYPAPQFKGLNALKKLLKDKGEIPLVIVSDATGEEQAVEIIKAGANDYVLKKNIRHLGPVVRRALFEAKIQPEHKVAAEALQQANREWEDLFQAIGQPSFILNPQHEILAINRAAVELLGKTEKELLGKKCFEVFHNIDRPAECCPMDKLLSSDRFEAQEMPVEVVGRTFLVACTPWFDENGRLEKVIHIATDITEAKAAEKALKKSEKELAVRNRIANVFLTASDEEVYEQVLEIIRDEIDSPFGVLGYLNDAGKLVSPSMTRDTWEKCQVSNKTFDFHPEARRDTIWGRAILEKKSLCFNQPSRVPNGHIAISKSLAAPIMYQSEVIGLIHLANKATDYDESDMALLEIIADYLAPILEVRRQRNREERKRHLAEEEVRKERDKAQNYLDTAGVMFVALDARGNVTLINKKGCEILGYTEDELIGQNWFDTCLPAAVRDSVKAVFANLMNDNAYAVEHYENPVITKSGEEKLVAWRNTILRDNRGLIIGALSSGEDITEEKRIEISLRESEVRYRTLFQHMSSGFAYHKIIVDEKGRPRDYIFLEINEAFEKLTGLSRDIIGKKVTEVLPGIEKNEPDFIRVYGEVALTGKPVQFESHAEPLNRWYSITAHSPQKGYFVAVFEEITERKIIEKEKLAHLYYSESMNQISEIMIHTLDLKKVIHSLVSKLLTIFNCDRTWLIYPCDPQAPSYRIFDEACVEEYPGLLAGARKEIPLSSNAAEIFQEALGTKKPVTSSPRTSPLPTSEESNLLEKYRVKSQMDIAIHPRIGKPWLLGLHQCSYTREWTGNEKRLFRDISYRFTDALNNLLLFQDLRYSEKALQAVKEELEQQNEELKTLDKLKDGLVRDVTHEMKTPVAKQKMQIDLLQRVLSEHGIAHECGKMLDVMRKSVRRQESVINNILNLSRLEAGGRKYRSEPMRLDLLLDDVLNDYREMFKSFRIKVDAELPSLTINSDREMLFHVFSNLVNNAVKYRKPSGDCWLGVFVKKSAQKVTIQIENNGIELTEEVRERAFDKFYQATASSEGSGVGLTIAKMIVSGLKGKIWLEFNKKKATVSAVVEIPIGTKREPR